MPSGLLFCILLCSVLHPYLVFVFIALRFRPYLKHTAQTSMPQGVFEPAIPVSDRPHTYALDRSTTGTGSRRLLGNTFITLICKFWKIHSTNKANSMEYVDYYKWWTNMYCGRTGVQNFLRRVKIQSVCLSKNL